MRIKTFRNFSNYLPFLFGVISGFSVFYFLYFFRAYGIQTGISYSGHSHIFRAISFGALTFLYLTPAEYWLKPKLKLKKTLHHILWYLTLVFIGAQLIFILFNFFWNWQEWDWVGYYLIMLEFPLMMIFPLVLYGLLRVAVFSTKETDKYLILQSESGKDKLKIRKEDFLYANSSENYINIQYLAGQSSKQHLIRKPLKNLENELSKYSKIKRCHRSYIVNKENIKNIKQDRGKIQIEIDSTVLPVSKKYESAFIN